MRTLRTAVLRVLPLALASTILPEGRPAAAPSHGPALMHQQSIAFELAADSAEVPMRFQDGRILVDVLLDGAGPFPFIFDTGAHGSVMDLAFARELGLDLGQEIRVGSPGGEGRPGYLVSLVRVALGGLTLEKASCVAFDGLPFPRTATSPRGVLSPYGLSGLLVTLDYPGQRVVFRRGELPAPDGRDVFGWDKSRGLPEIPAEFAGEPVLVHLDSGASGGVQLPTALAQRLPLDGPLRDMGYARTVDQVKAVRGAKLTGAFTIGRYRLENPTLRFVDMARGVGNVGAGVLSQFAITIDPKNARLRLAGSADGQLVVKEEPKPRYGIQLEALEASPIAVVAIDPGSPAARGGLREGDRILRMNDQPVESLGLDGRLEALKSSPLKLAVRRGGEMVTFTMTLD